MDQGVGQAREEIGGVMTFYRQCGLSKGSLRQVSWIPEQFATEGRIVRLLEDDGWRVDSVGESRKSDDFVRAHERDHAGHRARTDV